MPAKRRKAAQDQERLISQEIRSSKETAALSLSSGRREGRLENHPFLFCFKRRELRSRRCSPIKRIVTEAAKVQFLQVGLGNFTLFAALLPAYFLAKTAGMCPVKGFYHRRSHCISA